MASMFKGNCDLEVRTCIVMIIEIKRVNCLTNLIECTERKCPLKFEGEFERQLKLLLENLCVLLLTCQWGRRVPWL